MVKSSVKARPNLLWMYKKKDDAISSHNSKRSGKLVKGLITTENCNLFEIFLVSTTIHGRYYKDSHTVLGKTYGACVLQDFEALTPNLLARSIETVEGGGIVVLLLKNVNTFKQIFDMTMDVHDHFKTEAYKDVRGRFNERLIRSLADCKNCLFIDSGDISVLPVSELTAKIDPVDYLIRTEDTVLKNFQDNLGDIPAMAPLVKLCRTFDQAKSLAQIVETLFDKNTVPPTSITAARGRGKSALMGLCIAASIAFGYTNIYVTSPSPENLVTLFEFILKGFDALELEEHTHYSITRSTNPDLNKAIIRISVTESNKTRQTIQYFFPTDAHVLNAADLLVIDEAAAIPLPVVKSMLGPYITLLSSTINGYEGTGRSLSLKLLSQLQKEKNAPPPIKLQEAIRYSVDDQIEKWLNSLLCLDSEKVFDTNSSCPPPDSCDLYYVERDSLFSYHPAAETFLQKMVSILVASHYKNSPNDLQLLADAPAHHVFCLLSPITKSTVIPEIFVVIQVALEGTLSRRNVDGALAKGQKPSGDLIPWTVIEQYGDKDFSKLAGARVVRIATHPNYQRMGYGKRALKLLKDYYKGKFTPIDEDFEVNKTNPKLSRDEEKDDGKLLKPKKNIPTLLRKLAERIPEKLDYVGTCFGLTKELLRFWKSQKFVPVYLSQKENELTGEHSCLMVSDLVFQKDDGQPDLDHWLSSYFVDFRRRILKLSGKTFTKLETCMVLSLLEHKSVTVPTKTLTNDVIYQRLIPHDIQRLRSFVSHQIEYRLILDVIADLAQLFFENYFPSLQLNSLEKVVTLGSGLQNKDMNTLAKELNMNNNQVLVKFFDCIKKLTGVIVSTLEAGFTLDEPEKNLTLSQQNNNKKLPAEERTTANNTSVSTKKFSKMGEKTLDELNEFAIKGSTGEWEAALNKSDKSGILSVKVGEKKRVNEGIQEQAAKKMKKKNKKPFFKKMKK